MGVLGGLFLALALAVKFNKKIEETVSLSIMLLVFVIYAFGLAGILKIGVYADLGIIILSLGYLIFALVKDRTRVATSLLTWGCLALCFYIVFFAYYSHNRCYNHPDDFYCWGLMAKGYYYLQSLFSTQATAVSGEHPPFIPLLSYFGLMTWKEYADSIAFFVHSVFKISLLLPVFSLVKSKMSAPKFFSILLTLPLFHVISNLEGFDNVLADGAIALMLCFFVINVIKHIETIDVFYFISAMASLIAICLSKRVGFVMACLALLSVGVVYYKKVDKWYKFIIGYSVGMSVACLSWFKLDYFIFAVPMLTLGGVAILIWAFDKTNKLSGDKRNIVISLELFATIAFIFAFCVMFLGRKYGGYAYAVMARLGEDLFTVKIVDNHLVFSYGLFMVIGIVVVALIKNSTGIYKDIVKYILFFTVISMGMYLLAMLFIHIRSIGPYREHIEGLIQRYLIPWEIVVAFLIYLAFVIFNEGAEYLHFVIAFAVMLIISNSSNFYRGIFFKHYSADYSAFRDAGVELTNDDMIYYIDEEVEYGYAGREFFYHMFPAQTNFIYNNMSDNTGVLEYSEEELEAIIAERYNYVYIQSISDEFIEKYCSLFANPEDIKEKSVYEVEKSGESVTLKLIS